MIIISIYSKSACLVLFPTSKDLAPHFHEVGNTDAKEKIIKDEFCGEQKYIYRSRARWKNQTSSDSPEKANLFAKKNERI